MAKSANVTASPTRGSSLKRFTDAYWNYVKAVHGAWIPGDLQQRVEELRQLLQQAGTDVQKQCDAWRDHSNALKDARNPPEIQRKVNDAYRDCSFSPWHLSAINCACYAVACHAAVFWSQPGEGQQFGGTLSARA